MTAPPHPHLTQETIDEHRAKMVALADSANARGRNRARNLIELIDAIPVVENRAAAWLFTFHVLATSQLQHLTDPTAVAVALGQLKKRFWEAIRELRHYLLGRKTPPGTVIQRGAAAKGGLRPSERPLKSTRYYAMAINRFLRYWKAQGVTVTGFLDVPGGRRSRPTNHIDTYTLDEVTSIVKAVKGAALALIYAFLAGLDPATICQVRCSWLQRVQGRPCIVTPNGRKILLGPYWKAIFGLGHQRKKAAAKDTDPLLWLASMRHAKQRNLGERSMDIDQLRQYLTTNCKVSFNLGPEKLHRTGLASLAANKAPTEYLMVCADVQSPKAALSMEGFVGTVLDGLADGDDYAIALPQREGLVAGRTVCEACDTEQDARRSICENIDCEAPLSNPDAIEAKRWRLHRIIDELLADHGLSDADRERSHAEGAP